MAHQYMPKILHDPHKNPPTPPPTYLMYDPLMRQFKVKQKHSKLSILGMLLVTLGTTLSGNIWTGKWIRAGYCSKDFLFEVGKGIIRADHGSKRSLILNNF